MLKRKARLKKAARRKILTCFAHDLTATQTARLLFVNRNTVNRWYSHFRECILAHTEQIAPQFSGEVELDESYFGGPRKRFTTANKMKKGRGMPDKIPVFGILKRNGKVYTQIIKNASKKELLPIIRQVVRQQSTVYTDKWRAYDGLVFNGYKHYRINHTKEYSNRRGGHVNGIENFWSFAKRRLTKFNGVSRKTFLLHLKECEFRYNNKRIIHEALGRIIDIK